MYVWKGFVALLRCRLVASRRASSRFAAILSSSSSPRRTESRNSETSLLFETRAASTRKKKRGLCESEMFSSRFYLRSVSSYKRERCASKLYRLRRPDLPDAIVIFLEKFLVFVHKCGIASLGRPESLKIKQHRINKFMGRINIGAVAAFPISRESLFLPLSFSPCAKLLFQFTLHTGPGTTVFRFFMNKSCYCLSADETMNFGGFVQCRGWCSSKRNPYAIKTCVSFVSSTQYALITNVSIEMYLNKRTLLIHYVWKGWLLPIAQIALFDTAFMYPVFHVQYSLFSFLKTETHRKI